MGALMRSIDWSQTALGPVATWPQSLRTSVSTCLSSRFPILLWWGPELVMLYNDAYRPILGATKHPRAMGQRGRECWPEIWHIIGPMLEGVLERGEATWSEDQALPLDRNGFVEECYFTFSYSPIRDESGGVGGVFCAVTEETAKVIGQRRLATLAALARRSVEGRSADTACAIALETLGENPADVPFALVRRLEGGRLRDAGSVGLPSSLAAQLAASEPDALRDALEREVWIEDITRVFPSAGWSAHGLPRRAMALPLGRSAQGVPHGVLVAGVSPRLAFDERYRELYRLVADQLATSIRNALAHEEEAERARALAQLDRAKTQFFANVSHELRTPLTLLLGPLEELLGRPQGSLEDARPSLALAHRNALRLLDLVNALLEFSRIEAGRVDARFVPTDLATLTGELVSEFRSAIESAGLALELELDPLPAPVLVDGDMWERIVFNLLSNAIKYTHHGRIRVALRARAQHVELEVSDTGIGIPPHELPRLFQRFHRVEGARGRSHEGSGTGTWRTPPTAIRRWSSHASTGPISCSWT